MVGCLRHALPVLMILVIVGAVAVCPGPSVSKECAVGESIILTVPGLSFRQTLLPRDLQPMWGQASEGRQSQYLFQGIRQFLAEAGMDKWCVVDFAWQQDAKDTEKVVKRLTAEIKKLSTKARENGGSLVIVAHSWGTVLTYMALVNNLDEKVKIDLLVTLSSPLGTRYARPEGMLALEKVVDDFTQGWLGKMGYDKVPKMCHTQVRHWVNYCAWGDMISGPLAKSTDIIHLGPITDVWVDLDPATAPRDNQAVAKIMDGARMLGTPTCHTLTGLADNFSADEKLSTEAREEYARNLAGLKKSLVENMRPLAPADAPRTGGFATDFRKGPGKWQVVRGDWRMLGQEYNCLGSGKREIASISYPAKLSDFDYTVQMKRNGPPYYANGVFLRGDPSSMGKKYRAWGSGYYFAYVNRGRFIVAKFVNRSCRVLKRWTSSSAIKRNAWNELKIRAKGSTLDFHINGAKVFSTKDTSLTAGQVGILAACLRGDKDRLLLKQAKLVTLDESALRQQAYTLPVTPGLFEESAGLLELLGSHGDEPTPKHPIPPAHTPPVQPVREPKGDGRNYFQPDRP